MFVRKLNILHLNILMVITDVFEYLKADTVMHKSDLTVTHPLQNIQADRRHHELLAYIILPGGH